MSKPCLSISKCILNAPRILILMITLHSCQQLGPGSCKNCKDPRTAGPWLLHVRTGYLATPKCLTSQKSQDAALSPDALE